MSKPWLSVIMPTYNGEAYLGQTLESMEVQGDQSMEILVIDDGSTDATLHIVKSFGNRLPLRLLKQRHIGNWVAHTNCGLSEARGRYACFLHQDDVWLPGRLPILRRLASRHADTVLFFHPSHYIDSQGRDVGLWRSPVREGPVPPGILAERLLVQNFIAVPAPLFDRQAALRVGGLDESLWYTADWDFWLKLANQGPAFYHGQPLAAFRVHAQSQTAQGIARADEMHLQMETVLRRHLSAWLSAHPHRRDVREVSRLSVSVNHALAAYAYGKRMNWFNLGLGFLTLGPTGWYRFFRDSRIVERVTARLRANCYRREQVALSPGALLPLNGAVAAG
jgi:glycosyltransferase involved in cell wall biosynthesis